MIPISMSVSRDMPRQITVFPGWGSWVRARYPPLPGNTEAERFDNAVRKTFSVSKEEMQRPEAEQQKTQGDRPAKKL